MLVVQTNVGNDVALQIDWRIKMMKEMTFALAIPAAMAAGVWLSCPVVHADTYTFLADMEAAGFKNANGNQAELSVGLHVCQLARISGTPAAIRDLWFNSGMSQDESIQFVLISIRDLCPPNNNNA